MERVIVSGTKVFIPSRLIMSIDKLVFIENELPEDVVIEEQADNNGRQPSVTLCLKRLVKKPS